MIYVFLIRDVVRSVDPEGRNQFQDLRPDKYQLSIAVKHWGSPHGKRIVVSTCISNRKARHSDITFLIPARKLDI